MIKTLKNLLKQDKERYTVPRKVQDVIPVRRIWKDGIFRWAAAFPRPIAPTSTTLWQAVRQGADVPCLFGAAEQSGFRSDDENHHQQP